LVFKGLRLLKRRFFEFISRIILFRLINHVKFL
jgi:hypothetical protein